MQGADGGVGYGVDQQENPPPAKESPHDEGIEDLGKASGARRIGREVGDGHERVTL